MSRRVFRIIAICLTALCWMSAGAETHYASRVSIGGRAGLSMSQVSFSPSVLQSFAMGPTAAFTFKYQEEKLFALVAELGWAQRGWKENFEEDPYQYHRTLSYITIPVMTQISFGSRRFKCFVNLGPSASFLIGSSTSANFNYNNPLGDPDFPRRRQTEQLYSKIRNRFDYGILGGLGFEFFVQPRHSVLVEARYYFGLGNIFPSSKADTFSASRNSAIEVTLGYSFRLK